MKKGFLSKMDRVVLGAISDDEREAIIQRERKKVVSEVYATLRDRLTPLGVTLNGSCIICDDGRLRYQSAESEAAPAAKDDAPKVAKLLSRLQYYCSGYSYNSLARLITAQGGKVGNGSHIKAWIDGKYGLNPTNLRAVAKLIAKLDSRDAATMAQLTPVGVNRGWNT